MARVRSNLRMVTHTRVNSKMVSDQVTAKSCMRTQVLELKTDQLILANMKVCGNVANVKARVRCDGVMARYSLVSGSRTRDIMAR